MSFYLSVIFDSNYLNNIKDQNMFLILTEDNPPNPPQVIAKISNSYKANKAITIKL